MPVKIRISDMGFDLTLLKRLYVVGFPATLNLALPSLQVSVLNRILAVYSGSYVLVLGAYYKLQTFFVPYGKWCGAGNAPSHIL